ncbi:MAG: glycerophosphodiester phosphodiesterase family protein [Colwellia sp.]
MLKFIGHRFFADKHLENSPSGINFSIDNKVWAVETDIQLTKDKVPILMHDKTLNRTTNFSGFVKDFTIDQLNAKCRLLNGESIPTLSFLLEKLKGKGIKLYLEIISLDTIDVLPSYLDEFTDSVDIVVSSFHHELLLKVKEHNANQRTMALFECNPINPVALVKSAKVDEVGLGFDSVTKKLVSTLKNEKLAVYAWTVNASEEITRASKLGLDGVFTDKLQYI